MDKCEKCGTGYWLKDREEHPELCSSCADKEKEYEDMERLVGQRVTMLGYSQATGCYTLWFDNGLILTAVDGEYGDNAFKFTTKEELSDLG